MKKSSLLPVVAAIVVGISSAPTYSQELPACSEPIAALAINSIRCEAALCKDSGLLSRLKNGFAIDHARFMESAFSKLFVAIFTCQRG